jgi:hypothetical protein
MGPSSPGGQVRATLRAAQLLITFLILSAIAAACDQVPEIPETERISMTQAQDLVRGELLAQNPNLDPDVEFTLEEVTIDEIWNELGAQVFQLGGLSSDDTYVIVDRQVDRLGFAFGGYGVISMYVTDLDRNGEPELAYTYSWGSGLHRSHVAVYIPSHPEPNNIDGGLVYFHGDIILERVNDHNVFVKTGYHDWSRDEWIAETALGKLVLEHIDGQLQLSVELEDDIPPDVLERVGFP